jgi:hypothetical protein
MKKLESILNRVPSAVATYSTVREEPKIESVAQVKQEFQKEPEDRIVARIPKSLKKDIKKYLENNPIETERSLILKGLKAIGFNISQHEIEDKRRRR